MGSGLPRCLTSPQPPASAAAGHAWRTWSHQPRSCSPAAAAMPSALINTSRFASAAGERWTQRAGPRQPRQRLHSGNANVTICELAQGADLPKARRVPQARPAGRLPGNPCPRHGGGFLLAYGDRGVRSALTVRRESAAASVGAAVVSKAWRHHMKNPPVSSQEVGIPLNESTLRLSSPSLPSMPHDGRLSSAHCRIADASSTIGGGGSGSGQHRQPRNRVWIAARCSAVIR